MQPNECERIGAALTRGLTLPLTRIGVDAVRTSRDFEAAFASFTECVGASEQELAHVARRLRVLTEGLK